MHTGWTVGGVIVAISFTGIAVAAEKTPPGKPVCYDLKVDVYQRRNGKKKIIGSPRLRVRDGESSSISFGGVAAVPALAAGEKRFIPFGLCVAAQVQTIDRDRVTLELTFERREVECATKSSLRMQKRGCEATELAWLGTPVVMVLDQDSKEDATIVEVVVERCSDPLTVAPARSAAVNNRLRVRVPDQPLPAKTEVEKNTDDDNR